MYRSIPPLVALIAIVGAAFFGVVLADTLSGSTVSGRYAVDFENEQVQFCADDGVMDHLQRSGGDAHSGGYGTAELAVRALEADIRRLAMLGAESNMSAELQNELEELRSPARSFMTTESRSVDTSSGTIYYFDKPSAVDGILEARVVVAQTVAGQWSVLEVFRCESTIVTDYSRFTELQTLGDTR